MANIKSSKQDIVKSRERHQRNQRRKGQMRGGIRRARAGMEHSEENSMQLFTEAVSLIDRAASHGAIHRNAAARRKSRLARRLNIVQAAH